MSGPVKLKDAYVYALQGIYNRFMFQCMSVENRYYGIQVFSAFPIHLYTYVFVIN